jgi:hypothetical protein
MKRLLLLLVTPLCFAGEYQCLQAHKRLKEQSPRYVVKVFKEENQPHSGSWLYSTGPKRKPNHKEQMLLEEITETCALAGMGNFYRGEKNGKPTHHCGAQRSPSGKIFMTCGEANIISKTTVSEMKF